MSNIDVIHVKKTPKLIDALVLAYVHQRSLIWIPDSIVNIIIKFHGYYDISFESNILTQDNKMTLMELICERINCNIQLKRIYSGINDGFLAETFHIKCNNEGPTISVIKNEFDYIFGGHTTRSWTNNTGYERDSKAFLFQIYPNQKIFNINGFHNQIYNNPDRLCGFSDDLRIFNECNINNNSDSELWAYNIESAYNLVGGSIRQKCIRFRVIDVEVFVFDILE